MKKEYMHALFDITPIFKIVIYMEHIAGNASIF